MSKEITVPTLGESVTEGTIGEWLKKPGDAVAVDEPIASLETDKVAVELDSDKRTAMMTEALIIARDDVSMIALHQQPLAWGIRDGFHMKVSADNKPRLWYVTID